MFQIYLTDEMVDPSGKFTNGGEKNVTFCAIYILKRSFYQDRLGTNIGKTPKKDVFLRHPP
jgi:hypothetical protein